MSWSPETLGPGGIEPIDPPFKTHYRAPILSTNARFVSELGCNSDRVRYTVAREDIGPNDSYLWHVKVNIPSDWDSLPLLIDLSGKVDGARQLCRRIPAQRPVQISDEDARDNHG